MACPFKCARKKLGLLMDAALLVARLKLRFLIQHCSSAMVFLDPDYFGGYGWLFPKGFTANVGVGLLPANGLTPVAALNDFSEMLTRMGLTKPGWIARTSGFIPSFGIRLPIVVENILFCGDSAGLTHPITGAGIAQAVFSGDTAGEIVVKAIKTDNLSIVQKYQDIILRQYGGAFRHALSKKKVQLESWWRKISQRFAIKPGFHSRDTKNGKDNLEVKQKLFLQKLGVISRSFMGRLNNLPAGHVCY